MNEREMTAKDSFILIVDDDSRFRKILEFTLKESGYHPSSAENGIKALELMKEKHYDLILADLKMPGMNGIEFLQRVKEINPNIEVVMITAYASISSALEAMKLGAYDYITKPFKREEILPVIERALEKIRLERERLQLQETLSLYQVAKALTSTLEKEEILKLIVEIARTELKVDEVILYHWDEKSKFLKLSTTSGIDLSCESKDSRLELIRRTIEKGKVFQMQDKRWNNGAEGKIPDVFSALSLPLKVREQCLGVLWIAIKTAGRNFLPGEVRKAELLANIAAVALNNVFLIQSLNQSLQQIATYQEQLMQSSRLAIVGEMAASISHEIRNPLSAITLGLEYLRMILKDDEKNREALATLSEAADSLDNLVENLVGFAKKHQPIFEPLEINHTTDKALSLVHYHLTKNKIKVVKEYAEKLPLIIGDDAQLQEVFINIILNAKDAMPEGGTLTLITNEQKNKIVVEIRDTGCGISEENLGKIFESFYTTKSKGTGLGLSISHSIIKGHHGKISVKSKVGQGTTFTIHLPIIK
ncbi:MAG: response regulator [Candidatus Edwardsbacteria bacterium]